MPTCAIYARVSDESQLKGESIEHQISFCQEIARRRSIETGEPWIVADALTYVDEGITGTSLVKRAEVQRLVRDARERKFDVVMFKGISRFARDTVDALVMLRTLLACGVRVVSIEENFDSQRDNAEFVFTIHSALAQAESEKTAVRVRMGAMQKAREGKWNGPAPDGYILNPETKRLEIDPTYAPVIREIFSLYVNGYGVRKVSSILNENGQRTKRGYLWTQRAIARILTNPVYVGDVAYGRRERKLVMPSEEDLLARRKMTIWTKNTEQVIVCRDAHPPIVDRETFDKAAVLMAKRRTNPGRSGDLQLLSKGLLKCRCGSSMVVHYNTRGTRYYRCASQAERGRGFCNQPFIRADDVEALILDRVRADVADVLQFKLEDIMYEPTSQIEEEIRGVRNQLDKALRASQLLFERFADGQISEEQFEPMNKNFRERVSQLRASEQDLQKVRDRMSAQDDFTELLKDTMRNLLHAKTSDVHVTRQLLERLIQTVLVTGQGLEITYKFKQF
ncbi:recombinase family protein [Alicyclobacillus fastidiosus]|uniref:Recombinase family protein n=1 Tax=Alicyclobacillus fastidiosus TaxID=392011 RepID=A0ABY6ZMD5_9BACL|nr:recombinase family protein [Alicyclobacillus fastidiosus]WAH43259.1 recombinase family protein [Alicyclobacillus fastidiosus]GMA65304.1 serine recombinase [Alicyclobacillus fastidiosus]